MTWADVERRWHDFVEPLIATWPDLEEGRLAALSGDRDGLAQYLADCYELTVAEARDTIEDWLCLIAARVSPV